MPTDVLIESYFRIARDADDASESLCRGLSRLGVAHSSYGSMAGTDTIGQAWGSEYDEAVTTVFDGVGATAAALVSLSGRLKQTAYNWAEADGMSSPLPGEDRALGGHPSEITPPEVPSVVGDSGPGLQGLIDLAGEIGVPVPNGNTGLLSEASAAWRNYADEYVRTAVDVLDAGREIIIADPSPDIVAIEAEFVDLQHAVSETYQAVSELSTACEQYRRDLDDVRQKIRDEIESMLADAAVSAIIGIGLSLVTAGITGAVAAGVTAARVTRAASVVRELITAAAAVTRVSRVGRRVGEGLASLRGRLAELGGRAIKKFIGRAEKVPQPRKTVTFEPKKLDSKYDRHAAEDWGMPKDKNSANKAEFARRIDEFLNDAANDVYQFPNYKGQGPCIVTIDPESKLMVMQRPDGQFWSSWKLSNEQYASFLNGGAFW